MIGAEDAARVVETIARTAEQLGEDEPGSTPPAEETPAVLGCPAVDRADEVALRILADRLAADGITMDVLPAAMLTEEMDYLGSVRLSEVEQVQQQIVDIVRRLEDAGEITVHSADESEQMIS